MQVYSQLIRRMWDERRRSWYNYNNVIMIDLPSAQTFFWLCLGTSIFAVSAFICWVLFEVARMVRQGNEVVEHTRNVVAGIEEDFNRLKERFGIVLGDLAGMAKGVKAISALVGERDTERPTISHKKKRFNKLLQEEEDLE